MLLGGSSSSRAALRQPDTIPPDVPDTEYSSHGPYACRKGVSKGLLILPGGGGRGRGPRRGASPLPLFLFVISLLCHRRVAIVVRPPPIDATRFFSGPIWAQTGQKQSPRFRAALGRTTEAPLSGSFPVPRLAPFCCPRLLLFCFCLAGVAGRTREADRERQTGRGRQTVTESGRQQFLHSITLLLWFLSLFLLLFLPDLSRFFLSCRLLCKHQSV